MIGPVQIGRRVTRGLCAGRAGWDVEDATTPATVAAALAACRVCPLRSPCDHYTQGERPTYACVQAGQIHDGHGGIVAWAEWAERQSERLGAVADDGLVACEWSECTVRFPPLRGKRFCSPACRSREAAPLYSARRAEARAARRASAGAA